MEPTWIPGLGGHSKCGNALHTLTGFFDLLPKSMSHVSLSAEKSVQPVPLSGDPASNRQLTAHISSSDERMTSMNQPGILPGEAPAKQVDRPSTGISFILAHGVTEFVQVRDDRQLAGHHDAVGTGPVVAATAARAVDATKVKLGLRDAARRCQVVVQPEEFLFPLLKRTSPGS